MNTEQDPLCSSKLTYYSLSTSSYNWWPLTMEQTMRSPPYFPQTHNNPHLPLCAGNACIWWEGLGFAAIVGKGTESCEFSNWRRSFLAVKFLICSSNLRFSTWSWCNDFSIPKTSRHLNKDNFTHRTRYFMDFCQ